MSLWEALVLGLVQGATEFLPVSSSGHLVMTQALLGLDVPGILFEVTLHVATLLSVVIVYRERLAGLVAGFWRRDRDSLRYVALIVVASVPAGVLGLFFEAPLQSLFDRPMVTGVALLVTGATLWTSRAALRREGSGGLRSPTVWGAVWMGLAQAFAIIPGISRSGATVVTALWLGVEPREAAAFSFIMSLPVVVGAALRQTPDLAGTPGLSPALLLAGGLVAASTGVVAIRLFVAMLGSGSFHRFSLYCWLVGSTFLGYLFFT